MNSISINILNEAGTLIGRLDIGEAELNIVYQLADVKEPTKKQGDFTYPFTIPGTKNNNKIFSSIYELGFSEWRYNPNKKLKSQIVLNDNILYDGDLQLNAINKEDNKIIGYEITIYGKVPSFIDSLEDKNLNEVIDLSDYKHIYNRTNVVNSWSTSIIQNGVAKGFNLGDGYVYPMEWRGQNYTPSNPPSPQIAIFGQANTPIYWKVEDFKPSIYVKTIFDRLLASGGWTYQSNFLRSDYFKKLIIPYNGDDTVEYTETELKNLQVWAKYNAPPNRPILSSKSSLTGQSYPDIPLVFDDDTNSPAYDLGNNYNTTNGILTIPKNGKWTLSSTIRVSCEFSGAEYPTGALYSKLKIRGGSPVGVLKLKNMTTGQIVAQTNFTFTSSKFGGTAENTPVVSDILDVSVSYTANLAAGTQFKVFLDWSTTGSNYTYKTEAEITPGVFVQKNTYMEVRLQTVPLGTSYNPFSAPRFLCNLVNKTLSLGDMLDLNQFIPDMKAADFINEITKLFNLYWYRIGEKEFLIEPRNDFYGSKPIVDWTYKVDNLQEIKIEPLYDLVAKTWNFSYTEDNDYYNTNYFDNFNEVFGSKSVSVDNDFVVDIEEITSAFSPTPGVQYLNTDKVLPSYVQESSGQLQSYKPKLRLLFYGGFIPTTQIWNFIDPYTNIVIVPNFNSYPYAGHLDHPYQPNYDLNFAITNKYYFNWSQIPNSNLFNLFWRNYIEEITDKNSHLLTCRVLLNDYDIINFDLRSLVQIEGVYYRVNKLIYNPLTSEAELELFRAKDYRLPITSYITPNLIAASSSGSGSTQQPQFGGILSTNNLRNAPAPNLGYELPTRWSAPYVATDTNGLNLRSSVFTPYDANTELTFDNLIFNQQKLTEQRFADTIPTRQFSPVENFDKNDNIYSPQAAQKVLGSRNIIDPTAYGIDIVGNDNNIASNTQNIIINGNGNFVAAGLSNITVIGNNQVITKSDFSYIRGVVLADGSSQKQIDIYEGPVNDTGFTTKVISGGKNSVAANKVIKG